jgi:hypothetical protein
MTGIKSLSCKVGMILLSIGLFVVIRCLERSETKWINCYGHLPAYCNTNQQSTVSGPKNILRGSITFDYSEKSVVKTGPRLGHRWYPKSENIPIILFLGVAVWGAAIIFVLGLILYRLVVEPLLIGEIKTE